MAAGGIVILCKKKMIAYSRGKEHRSTAIVQWDEYNVKRKSPYDKPNFPAFQRGKKVSKQKHSVKTRSEQAENK